MRSEATLPKEPEETIGSEQQKAIWNCLEAIPRLVTSRAVWSAWSGGQFAILHSMCLEETGEMASWVPCPFGCGIDHDVYGAGEGLFAGECPNQEAGRGQFRVSQSELAAYSVNWPRLARRLSAAFALEHKFAAMSPPQTVQFGAWSAEAVPVILTVQVEQLEFRRAVAELAALLRRSFILFAPTSDYLDAPAQAILQNHGAAFFALDTVARITPQGMVMTRVAPGVLFKEVTPAPEQTVDENVARQLFALAKALDSGSGRKAPLFTVFRLYCMDGLSADQIATRCRCHRSLVFSRLKGLAKHLGRNPAELREYSSHFEAMERSLADPRARRKAIGEF